MLCDRVGEFGVPSMKRISSASSSLQPKMLVENQGVDSLHTRQDKKEASPEVIQTRLEAQGAVH